MIVTDASITGKDKDFDAESVKVSTAAPSCNVSDTASVGQLSSGMLREMDKLLGGGALRLVCTAKLQT